MLQAGEDACAVDVETTGVEPLAHALVSIGCARIVRGRIEDVREWRVRPHRGAPWSEEAARVHGIGREEAASAPALAQVWPEVTAFVGTLPCIAHHADFDRGFLAAAARGAGLPTAFLEPRRWTCTWRYSRREHPERAAHGLDALTRNARTKAHRAGDDAERLARVWLEWGDAHAHRQTDLWASSPHVSLPGVETLTLWTPPR